MMDRKEFFEWLNTCPTHKYEVQHDEDEYVCISFRVPDEEEEKELV